MSITMLPTNLTGDNNATGPAVGMKPPRRMQRETRPDSQLTDQAALTLLNGGRLQQRDLRVVETVWAFNVMTSTQIQRLLFDGYANEKDGQRVAHRRLRFLYNEYCLDRVFRGLGVECVYRLDVQGARLIQTPALRAGASVLQQKKNRRDIKWSPKSIGEKLLQLEHYLGVTEFGVRLTEAARSHQGRLDWLGENVLTLTKADGRYFEPDGAGLLQVGEARLAFWLEWDQGTESFGVLRGKLRNYVEFFKHREGWQGIFQRYPVLLLATTTQSRVEHILGDAKHLLTAHQIKPSEFVILLTTHAALDQHGQLGPAWYRVGSTQPLHLAWEHGVSLVDVARALSKPRQQTG